MLGGGGGECSELTLLIMLFIVKCLVWVGGRMCGPERLVDGYAKLRELLWLSRAVVLVIGATAGVPEKETRGRGSLGSVVERDRRASMCCMIKFVLSVKCCLISKI